MHSQTIMVLCLIAGYLFGLQPTASCQDTKLKFDSSYYYYNTGTEGVLTEKIFRQYNASGSLTTEESYKDIYKKGNWHLVFRVSQIYNDNGLLKEKITEYRYSGNKDWDSTIRETYIYKENRLIARLTNKQYANRNNKQETITKQERVIYTHDNNSNITSVTNEQFADGQWKVIFQQFYTYYPDNKLKYITDSSSIVTYLYDKSGKLTEVVAEKLKKSFKKDQGYLYKTEYSYHPNGDLKKETRKIFLTTSVPKATFSDVMSTYNPKVTLSSSSTHRSYIPAHFGEVTPTGIKYLQKWDTEHEFEYILNENNLPETILKEWPSFDIKTKKTYTYNPDNSVKTETSYRIYEIVKPGKGKVVREQTLEEGGRRLYFY